MAERDHHDGDDSLDAIDAKIKQLESHLLPDANHGDDDEHDVSPESSLKSVDIDDKAADDVERWQLESAMNKDSTGAIKLPPKYLNDSGRQKPKAAKRREQKQEYEVDRHQLAADEDEMAESVRKDDLAEALKMQYLKLSEEIELL